MAQAFAGERVAVKVAACVFAAALCLWGVFADASEITVCDMAESGASCPGAVLIDESAVVSSQYVFTCRGVTVTTGDPWYACGDSGASGAWIQVSSLVAGDWVWFDAGYRAVETAAFFEGGGEEEPAAEVNLLGIPDLTAVQWGQITNAFLGLFAVVATIGIIRKSL